MKTKAILHRKFNRGFILNQENVIKIKDITTQRLNLKLQNYYFLSKIYREDSLVYTTQDINDVFKEENSKRNRIIEIEFSINHDEFEMHLVFEKDDGCYLIIESDDKDIAYLTFSDIKEYLNSEVLKQSPININKLVNDKLFSMFIMLLSMLCGLFTVVVTKYRPSQEIVHKLIESTDINEKMNFVLNYYINTHPASVLTSLFFGIATSFISIFLICLTLKKLYPQNIFYFGKEVLHHDRIQDLKSKFSWVIATGLFISVIGGLIANSILK